MTAAASGGPLGPLAVDPRRSGLFSDFDGTLAAIVDDPATARPVAGAVAVLARLARRLHTVAVVSGRPAGFLWDHFGGTGVALWGLHGLESVEDGEVVPAPEAAPWRAVVTAVAGRAAAELRLAGGVEAKGLSLTLHYRRSPGDEDRVREWAAREAAATGLVVHPARMSVELRPPVPHGKGLVVEGAAHGLSAAAFLGDDAGDLDAFDALDRLAARGLACVRVGVNSPEAPAALLARADAVADGPAGVVALLEVLADALGE